MTTGLRAGISFCEIGDRIIFLDLQGDRYFGLEAPAEAAFRRLIAAKGSRLEDDGPTPLLTRGFVVDDAPIPPTACRPAIEPSASLLDVEAPSARPLTIMWAIVALWRARRSLRQQGLEATLHAVTARKIRRPSTSAPIDEVRRIANAFDRSAHLTRSHDQCLVRSIAISHHLASIGAAFEMVIGVRLRPFAAHSWVQHDHWLVNDRLDQVRTYTPILVL